MDMRLSLFSVVFCVVLCPNASQAGPLSSDAEEHRVVRLYCDKDNKQEIGAGFFIHKDGILLTAYHVIQGASKVEIVGIRDAFTNPRVVMYDAEWDLAVLAVDSPGNKPVPILPVGLQLPEKLSSKSGVIIGHPG